MTPSPTIKWVLLFIPVVLLATWAQGQDSAVVTMGNNYISVKHKDWTYTLDSVTLIIYDSVELEVTYSKKKGRSVIYIFKLPSGEKVKSVCYCKEQRKKGDVVTVAKKDIEFIKPTF